MYLFLNIFYFTMYISLSLVYNVHLYVYQAIGI